MDDQTVPETDVNTQAQTEQAQNEQVAASIPTEAPVVSTDAPVETPTAPVVPETPVETVAPIAGTSETHVNAFKQDVSDALGKIHTAINDAEDAIARLLTKLGV